MFELTIVTPEKKVYEGLVHSLKAPGEEGAFQILSHHAPLIASLCKGELVIEDQTHQKITLKVVGGFLEVSPTKVSVLADAIEE
ncbi:ATP synthase F1 subunit epsilon [Parachlamydia sp. AcF125]|uniref:ATP synthase F1 subunit epsilon n=1 Tax=Parachlamydia sp. AcF125 TaxID=2795736 RepID=UPI001BC8D8E9|nr:ATP synthase F1 subunit epsilon [Parachlamydia sp. AcF125]MBS4167484.1 ATP synthase epsilon chain [Parachlamydia sp. AcF125]